MDTELKRLRLSNHETQATIASAIGIDVKTYRRYENGKQIPPLDTAYRLALYYHLLIENIIPPETVLPELRKEEPS
ncbi:MAG: helix-turn-helix domain-containing protein [Lachnospiraceae bacterium]|nr:helix-turn-helix domain-containing protein [Lachnospiraceae bacterium]